MTFELTSACSSNSAERFAGGISGVRCGVSCISFGSFVVPLRDHFLAEGTPTFRNIGLIDLVCAAFPFRHCLLA